MVLEGGRYPWAGVPSGGRGDGLPSAVLGVVMRVMVEVAGALRFPALAPPTVKIGDRVLVEGNPLRLGDQDVEGVVVEIGPGSVPARRVLEVLEPEEVELEVELTEEGEA
jgi:hypothetical protein